MTPRTRSPRTGSTAPSEQLPTIYPVPSSCLRTGATLGALCSFFIRLCCDLHYALQSLFLPL